MAAASLPHVPRAGEREAIAIHTRFAAIWATGDIVPETENLTTQLASLLLSSPSPPPNTLRILDLCTGTGCIPLLLYTLLSSRIPSLHFCGVDISPAATTLANKNLSHNISSNQLPQNAREQISFVRNDIFAARANAWNQSKWDILISNPPYISPTSFNSTTTRSVRNYEPRSALVPAGTPSPKGRVAEVDAGDTFYPRLLEIAEQVSAQVLLIEVGGLEQAFRVVAMVTGKREGAQLPGSGQEPNTGPISLGSQLS
ncbi:MAG: hypothetical protein ASARMPRED_005600 [Alectoria sarmentosa]|nr:MAG: hypothetical protein ASARMPRED_005600 [Alectoria sarmentosa]